MWSTIFGEWVAELARIQTQPTNFHYFVKFGVWYTQKLLCFAVFLVHRTPLIVLISHQVKR